MGSEPRKNTPAQLIDPTAQRSSNFSVVSFIRRGDDRLMMVPYLSCQHIVQTLFSEGNCWRWFGCETFGVSQYVSRPGTTKFLILGGRRPLFLKRRLLILYHSLSSQSHTQLLICMDNLKPPFLNVSINMSAEHQTFRI